MLLGLCDFVLECLLFEVVFVLLECWVMMYEDLCGSLCCCVIFDVLVEGLLVYVGS